MAKWWDKYFDEPIVPEQGFIILPAPSDPILLGRQAEDALRNPAIQIALDKIESDIVNAWKTSAPKDEEAREHLYYRLDGLALFKTKLQGFVNNMLIENKRQTQKVA